MFVRPPARRQGHYVLALKSEVASGSIGNYVCSVARLTLCRHHGAVDGQATWGICIRAAARREKGGKILKAREDFEISEAARLTYLGGIAWRTSPSRLNRVLTKTKVANGQCMFK